MKYALLVYNNSGNLGDEIQSIAARRFLPRVDLTINRDRLNEFKSPDDEAVLLIMNCWFGHQPENWPPSPDIVPLLISMHISTEPGGGITKIPAAEFLLHEEMVNYLRGWGHVGARDLHTLKLLEDNGVPSYFSGCVTLTLQRSADIKRQELVIVNDLPDSVVAHVRKHSRYPILLTSHADSYTSESELRFTKAQALLNHYQSAACVITSRLHCALPCLAFGTPVFVVDAFKDQTRYSGLNNLYRHCSVDEFLSGKSGIDINHPEPNSDEFLSFRSSLEQRISNFIELGENASPDIRPDESWLLRARMQTLVALHAEQSRRLAETELKLKRQRIRKTVTTAIRRLAKLK
jgi:hypothetical protein